MVTTTMGLVLVMEPLQPMKVELGSAVAVTVTTVPWSNRVPVGSLATARAVASRGQRQLVLVEGEVAVRLWAS